jgi:hypothetical protein
VIVRLASRSRQPPARNFSGAVGIDRVGRACCARNQLIAGSRVAPATSTSSDPRLKYRISWFFMRFQRISTDLSTGLSTEYVDGLSKQPY